MLVRSTSHLMGDLSCQEMVRVSAGFGIGRVAKSLVNLNVMKGYALESNGIHWSKVRLLPVAGMV